MLYLKKKKKLIYSGVHPRVSTLIQVFKKKKKCSKDFCVHADASSIYVFETPLSFDYLLRSMIFFRHFFFFPLQGFRIGSPWQKPCFFSFLSRICMQKVKKKGRGRNAICTLPYTLASDVTHRCCCCFFFFSSFSVLFRFTSPSPPSQHPPSPFHSYSARNKKPLKI